MAFPQDALIALGMHAPSSHGLYGLPVVLIFILLLVNDRNRMQSHTNGRVFNAVAWLASVVRIALTVVLLVGGSASGVMIYEVGDGVARDAFFRS